MSATNVFYYFLPGEVHSSWSSIPNDVLKKFGLYEAFHDWNVVGDNILVSTCEVVGQQGTFLAPRPAYDVMPDHRTNNSEITFFKFKSIYIGYDESKGLPSPESMSRGLDPIGYDMRSGDGVSWRIPIIHSPEEARQFWVPNIGYNADGTFMQTRPKELDRAWRITEMALDAYVNGTSDPPGYQTLLRWFCVILNLTYRITNACIYLYSKNDSKFFTVENAQTAVLMAADVPLVMECKKKSSETLLIDTENSPDAQNSEVELAQD